MGAFDKIVAAVSPRRACEREAWRQQLEILRGYDAAGYGRLNAGWRVHNESAEVTDRFSRSAFLVRNRTDFTRLSPQSRRFAMAAISSPYQ